MEWSGQLCVCALLRKSSPSRGEATPNSNGLDWLAVCGAPLPSGPVPPEAGLASWAGVHHGVNRRPENLAEHWREVPSLRRHGYKIHGLWGSKSLGTREPWSGGTRVQLMPNVFLT